MLEQAKAILKELEIIDNKLSDPSVIDDMKKYTELNKKRADLSTKAELAKEYIELTDANASTQEIIDQSNDPEMTEMAKEEMTVIQDKINKLEEDFKIALIPEDPLDKKDVIIEIRAGAGGDEAGIFGADLMRMYIRFAESKGWNVEIINKNEGQSGAIKEATFSIKGTDVFKSLKWERGVHRVQRIPVTESQGRIHTSTATVAVLPDADEVDIEVKDSDLRFDVFRSSGPGGQSVNTTDSAVRVTHVPSGLIVTCQDEKSQHKNKAKALSVMRARLFAIEQERRDKEAGDLRRSQIGTGDRSEKIRTYNYPQDRITDHRIKVNWSNIPEVMDGKLDHIIETMQKEDIKNMLMLHTKE